MKKNLVLTCILLMIFGTQFQFAAGLKWEMFGNMTQARQFFQALPINDSIVIAMGGQDRGRYINSCDFINVRSRNVYAAPSMLFERAYFKALLTKDSNLIAIGGINQSKMGNTSIELFDRKTNKWTLLGNMLEPRLHFAAEWLNDQEILIIGGRASASTIGTNTCEIFNTSTKLSRYVAKYDSYVCDGVLGKTSTGKLWAFGFREGGTNSYRETNVMEFDEATNNFNDVTSLNDAVQNVSICHLPNGQLVVTNGSINESPLKASNQILIEENGAFVSRSSTLVATQWQSLAYFDKSTVLKIGGLNDLNKDVSTTEFIDFTNNSVVYGPSLNVPRNVAQVVRMNSSKPNLPMILIIGGTSNIYTNTLSSIEILEFETEPPVEENVEISTINSDCGIITLQLTGTVPIQKVLLNSNSRNVSYKAKSAIPGNSVILEISLIDFASAGFYDLDIRLSDTTVIKSTGNLAPSGSALEIVSPVDSLGFYDMGEAKILSSNSKEIRITNTSSSDFIINDPYMYNNIEFSLPLSQFPLTIKAGDTVSLLAVYMPNHLGIGKDSLRIKGLCGDLKLKLKGYGTANNYSNTSKCDINLTLETRDFDTRIAGPYPNPSTGSARLMINSEEQINDISIFDSFGNAKENFTCEISSVPQKNGFSTSLNINLSGLQSGIYFIRINQLGLVKAIVLE